MGDSSEHAVGSIAEEAAKLFDALSSALGPEPVGSTACEWCPICRVTRMYQDLSPEVRSHLAAAAVSLAKAAEGFLAPSTTEGDTHHDDAEG